MNDNGQEVRSRRFVNECPASFFANTPFVGILHEVAEVRSASIHSHIAPARRGCALCGEVFTGPCIVGIREVTAKTEGEICRDELRRTPVLVASELCAVRRALEQRAVLSADPMPGRLVTCPERHPSLGATDPVPVPLGSGLILEGLASERRIHKVNVIARTDPEIYISEHLGHERLLLCRSDGREVPANSMQRALGSEIKCAVVRLACRPCKNPALLRHIFIKMSVERIEADPWALLTD